MTYLEYRQLMSRLALKHAAERLAITEAYNAEDKTDARAERARVAREGRSVHAYSLKAQRRRELWDSWGEDTWRSAQTFIRTSEAEYNLIVKACEISNGRYTVAANSKQIQVTRHIQY